MKAILELHEMPKNCLECPCASYDLFGQLVCREKDENGVMLVWRANKYRRRKNCRLKEMEANK